MREKVKDKGRLEHILQACNDLLASKDKYTFDAVKDDPIMAIGDNKNTSYCHPFLSVYQLLTICVADVATK